MLHLVLQVLFFLVVALILFFFSPLGLSSGPAPVSHQLSEHLQLEFDWTDAINQTLPSDSSSSETTKTKNNIKMKPQNPTTPQNSLDSQNLVQPDLDKNNFESDYKSSSKPSFDPYGFKLSPEHSQFSFLDPDEVEFSPKSIENIMRFDPEASSSPPHKLNFDPYQFEITVSQMVCHSDPYGFKLSPEEENQEVPDLCGHDNLGEMGLCTYENNEQMDNFNFAKQGLLKPHTYENQELFEPCEQNFQKLPYYRNRDIIESSNHKSMELAFDENQKVSNFSWHENQEVVEPCSNVNQEKLHEVCSYDSQEVLETCDDVNQELLAFSHPENQEVLDLDPYQNQEILSFGNKENLDLLKSENQKYKDVRDLRSNKNQELLDVGMPDNQESLDLINVENLPKGNNTQCNVEAEANLSSTNSSESDLGSENLVGLELSNTNICSANTINNVITDTLKTISNISANQGWSMSNNPKSQSLLEGDLGSVFGAGGYIGCSAVADDLEPLKTRKESTRPETAPPVRPPRPSLRVS